MKTKEIQVEINGQMYIRTVNVATTLAEFLRDDLQLTGFAMNGSVGKLAGYFSLNEIYQLHSPVPVGGGVGSGLDFVDNAEAGIVQLHDTFLFLESQKTHLKF